MPKHGFSRTSASPVFEGSKNRRRILTRGCHPSNIACNVTADGVGSELQEKQLDIFSIPFRQLLVSMFGLNSGTLSFCLHTSNTLCSSRCNISRPGLHAATVSARLRRHHAQSFRPARLLPRSSGHHGRSLNWDILWPRGIDPEGCMALVSDVRSSIRMVRACGGFSLFPIVFAMH